MVAGLADLGRAVNDTVTARLVARCLAIPRDLPHPTRDAVRSLLQDGIGVMVAASASTLSVRDVLDRHLARAADGPCQVVGRDRTVAADTAAFVNGTFGHLLDFEPMMSPPNHPMSPTVPAILAVAQDRQLPADAVIAAIAAAVEAQFAIRRAVPGLKTGAGFHKPGTVGLLGGTIGVAHLQDLDVATTVAALGVAGSRAAGLSVNAGTGTKSTHAGHGARMAVESVQLAADGLTASADVLGPGGLLDALVGEQQRPEELDAVPAPPYRIVDPGVGYKLSPSNIMTQQTIVAGQRLREAVTADDIAVIALRMAPVSHVDRPQLRSGLDGKFSVQYCLSRALLDGRVTPADFTDDRVRTADIQRLMQLIELTHDPDIPTALDATEATVTVRTTDGTEHREHVTAIPGMPELPLTATQRRDKFHACCDDVLGVGATTQLADAIDHFDGDTPVSELLARTIPA